MPDASTRSGEQDRGSRSSEDGATNGSPASKKEHEHNERQREGK
jgi:hypothetical protein